MKALGKDPNEVIAELGVLRRGAPCLNLMRPCSVSDGILRLSNTDQTAAEKRFDRVAPGRHVAKFVAASGSASRMFQALTASAVTTGADARTVAVFGKRLRDFPFFLSLRDALGRQEQDIDCLLAANDWRTIVGCLTDDSGLGYGRVPKALIPFHAYPDGTRTAAEEHLLEASCYAADREGAVDVHFTVASEHRAAVQAHLERAAQRFEQQGLRFRTGLSVQPPSTHTLPLDSNLDPLRTTAGRLVFRPSGHGALLSNLNDFAGDIVFVRTIDNILPDVFRPLVCFHKKIMGGLLLTLESEIHHRLERLHGGDHEAPFLDDTARFVETQLSVRLPVDWSTKTPQARRSFLFQRLHRPLRVCAVVPNHGQPGGAPFWVQDHSRPTHLRIVEAPEVDFSCDTQRRIWDSAAFFNPADIVCSLRSFSGSPFNLHDYQDPAAWMVITRSQHGRTTHTLERPGFWNGGMADWNTVFLEAPKATCRPVKTVADLLDLPELAD